MLHETDPRFILQKDDHLTRVFMAPEHREYSLHVFYPKTVKKRRFSLEDFSGLEPAGFDLTSGTTSLQARGAHVTVMTVEKKDGSHPGSGLLIRAASQGKSVITAMALEFRARSTGMDARVRDYVLACLERSIPPDRADAPPAGGDNETPGHEIRLIRPEEHGALREMLYHAVFVAPGSPLPDRAVVNEPELSRFVSGWGRPGDIALVAVVHATPGVRAPGVPVAGDHRIIGAAWQRLFSAAEPSYGFVDEETPVVSLAVVPGHRGNGIGTELMRALIARGANRGFKALSLSVDPANPAIRLYSRLGFVPNGDGGKTLVLPLGPQE